MKKDVIESPVESIKGNEHPAVYPIYVVQQLIKLLTPDQALVVDPFCGSGTTCLAAKQLSRRYLGIDINSEYVDYARRRLAEAADSQTEDYMNDEEVLEHLYKKAESSEQALVPEHIERSVSVLLAHIEKNKSVVAALVTSLLKKIQSPEQDVRLHRADFKGGYSARVLDTQVTSPFFKRYLPKYANKESSFLTLATREKIKWTKREGQAIKIRNAEFKAAFLDLLDTVEAKKVPPELVLERLFSKLIALSKSEQKFFEEVARPSSSSTLNIPLVIQMLQEHFSVKNSSRLPVIAVFAIYQELLNVVKRYDGATLQPLKVHTSSDRKGYGDIEVFDKSAVPFEAVEVKHNIALDRYLILDVIKKSAHSSIQRYYVLTTADPCFKSIAEEDAVNELILTAKRSTGLEVIANGIIHSLKYYLRFVDNLNAFIDAYTRHLIADANIPTEVTKTHIQTWQEILKRYKLLSNDS